MMKPRNEIFILCFAYYCKICEKKLIKFWWEENLESLKNKLVDRKKTKKFCYQLLLFKWDKMVMAFG